MCWEGKARRRLEVRTPHAPSYPPQTGPGLAIGIPASGAVVVASRTPKSGRHRRRRDRTLSPGDRGDAVFLHAGGAAEHPEVRCRIRVHVRVCAGADTITIEVVDDGCGFDMQHVSRGAGLTNMEDRLDARGGRLQIELAPGAGTTLRASAPVAALVPAAAHSSCRTRSAARLRQVDRGSNCGGRIRTDDLRVMSPTSFHCSTPLAEDTARGRALSTIGRSVRRWSRRR